MKNNSIYLFFKIHGGESQGEKKKGKQFKTICLLGQKSRMRKKCRYGPLVFVIGFVELLKLIDLTEKFLREVQMLLQKIINRLMECNSMTRFGGKEE